MKKALRQKALAYRTQLSDHEVAAFQPQIHAGLLTLLQTFRPCTVGLYHPVRGEPDILEITGNLVLEGFEWALPVCCDSPTGPLLQFAGFHTGDLLEVGQYNILVPQIKTWVQPQVLLIPCVAFHRQGARLGYGAGWYDRTLQNLVNKPVAVGIAYSGTESKHPFAEPHDQLLDFVVTENSVIHCKENRT
ncbi:5-formyltetrahydrofolate cyclo-ligase [Limnobacter parvus]|uniref:5-formyltetrahydrofolate cyclo-ligase n=1 Tax=Limnobacter parvus TaxID=2939690 RepID=A0ABT1XHM7_9BURK|nr:5-formyltetrahydrofolate cyclo-ligase [Limnobacter parvus]MCR2746401.1 5-formyltetrahydrofolate cyclo-ligase [Limnobacter parvus]